MNREAAASAWDERQAILNEAMAKHRENVARANAALEAGDGFIVDRAGDDTNGTFGTGGAEDP
ncbi:unnamed protein product [Symbiodinium sp. CCMP2592]|nr:unnamed protein product [Symbiodinium sp. CCMP2592]